MRHIKTLLNMTLLLTLALVSAPVSADDSESSQEKKQMWTPVVLLCLTENLTECIAIGGPLSTSEESCVESALEVGIPYMKTKHSDKIIAEYKCIKWGTEFED